MNTTRRLDCDPRTAMQIASEFYLLLYTARFGRLEKATQHLRELARLGVNVSFNEQSYRSEGEPS